MAKMRSADLSAIIGRQVRIASGGLGNEIATARADLHDAYMGEPYGDEVADRSQVVSTDIADTVEWIMPELMEIFTSGDTVVDFDPLGPDDEPLAQQETEVVNHVVMRKNAGFLALYSMFKDALIQKVGYIKRYHDDRERIEVEEYEGLTEPELALMAQGWRQDGAEVEILEQSAEAGEDGAPAINIKVQLTWRDKSLRVAPVPPEEMLIAPRWNSVFLQDCPFVAHKRAVTVTELIELGYDPQQVRGLTSADDDELEELTERFDDEGSEEADEREPTDETMREIRIHECYIRVDYDGDGKAELRKVTVGGAGYEVLKWADGGEDNEQVACIPFSAITPIIVPHKHYGRSVAELVQDLQRIKTVLMRNLLDNVYLTNNPMTEIAEDGIGQNTLEDLLSDRPGKVVRTAMPGHMVVHSPPQFIGQLLPTLEYVDTIRENRTGVTRYNQGLDANSLNKTATGVQQIMSAAQKKIALIARIFAETGVKDLFLGVHGDLRRHSNRAMTLRLRGGYVQVDPRHWRHRSDVSVNVALGTGNKEQMVARLMMLADKQEQHLLNGSPLFTPQNLFNTYTQIIEKSGFKNAQAYITDPSQQPPKPPQPDPVQQQAEMLMQIETAKVQAKAQADMQAEQLKHQREMQAMQMEDARERERMAMEMALKREEARLNLEIKRETARMNAAVAASRPAPEAQA